MRTLAGTAIWLATMALLGGCRGPQPVATPAPAAQPAVDPMIAVHTLIDAPPDFVAQRLASGDYPIPPYAKFLAGVKICLDPGHGGDAAQRGYKRGPTGVREAEFNLRVACYLRELLTGSGAEVLLTREDDADSSLEDRARVANEWNADMFVSLHHNAIDNKPQVNHTTVWYHADVDYRPSNLDLARYLCDGLYDALALPEITAVPLKSDQLMYAGGFGILRHAQVTAALCETSFFTNPDEEQRLRQPEYNLREAYGLFIALAKYAAAGLPRAQLVEPADGKLSLDAGRTLVFALDDGLRGRKSWGSERQMILTDSITARIDGQLVPLSFANDGYRLTLEVPDDLTIGTHAVEVQFQNMNKNSVLNPHFAIEVQGEPAAPEEQ